MLKIFKKRNKQLNQKGFTLLEILVVVAIMGFLVAMVAPRFAGIVGNTEDVVCDTNQQRMVAAVATYYETKGGLPSGLVNLVDQDGELTLTSAGAYEGDFKVPSSTGDLEFSDEGKATFAAEFMDRSQFALHILNDAEAQEIRKLGIGSVYNLNAYNYEGLVDSFVEVEETNQQDPMKRVGIRSGLGVLMVGLGAESDANDPAFDGFAVPSAVSGILQVDSADYEGWGNPEWIGRIFFGVGTDSDLVKEGMISTAGLCPTGLNDEQITWNHYGILLPRLEATVERLEASATANLASLENIVAKANGGVYRVFNLLKEQKGFEFVTQCPEGHMYPESEDFEEWTIYAGAAGVTEDEKIEAAKTAGL
ncbi:type II secretion system GspH family protein [Desulfobotulus sp. H1]|uniref:Type II secretion system GspH family protein n=1 Tax=Desulfobotulus pelophilus TaxID=2823377 RepID=A0ABT3NA61_9BACT|nr:type II secretion system protein [Desulfobotulus pelophilus]MCW7754066.1 type II secretion system GspH family protein [Desulfobotulus pelophilus]